MTASGDIAIVFDPATCTGDFQMAGPGLLLGEALETAVLISLFTDHVTDPADILPPGQAADPRGWWADTYEGDLIGSKLWQVFWRQTTTDTLNWITDTATKALQWMLDDNVAASVSVVPQFIGKGQIGMTVTITEPSGKASVYSYAWSQVG